MFVISDLPAYGWLPSDLLQSRLTKIRKPHISWDEPVNSANATHNCYANSRVRARELVLARDWEQSEPEEMVSRENELSPGRQFRCYSRSQLQNCHCLQRSLSGWTAIHCSSRQVDHHSDRRRLNRRILDKLSSQIVMTGGYLLEAHTDS